MSEISSLTSPSDQTSKFKASVSEPPLSKDEISEAMEQLYRTSLVSKYPKLERSFVDPAIPLQQFGLLSFIPSKGATPDKDGIFGMAKIRGHYATEQEANERSEFIIRNVDSYHPIDLYYVGRPFPISVNSEKFAKTVNTVDIKQAITQTISADVKEKREKERAEIADIKEREKRLLEQSKDDYEESPYEKYTTLLVKRAQLIWTYKNMIDRLNEVKNALVNVRADLRSMDDDTMDYYNESKRRYMEARDAVGIPADNAENGWIQYLVQDIDIGF